MYAGCIGITDGPPTCAAT